MFRKNEKPEFFLTFHFFSLFFLFFFDSTYNLHGPLQVARCTTNNTNAKICHASKICRASIIRHARARDYLTMRPSMEMRSARMTLLLELGFALRFFFRMRSASKTAAWGLLVVVVFCLCKRDE